MSLLTLFLWIVIIGVVVLAIRKWAPIPEEFKQIALTIGIVVIVILALKAFGVLEAIGDVQVPQVGG